MALTRRRLAAGLTTSLLLPRVAFGAAPTIADFNATLARIEAKIGGRLGCALIDTGTGARAGHRVGERFPLCSTFKVLAAAALLQRVDDGRERLDRRVTYSRGDLVAHSPETQKHVEGGMTLAEICAAAITQSDNTAGNLILAALGGPSAVTAFARAIGDEVTRLDRTETALNEAAPGDPRDTTTPAAMAADLLLLTNGTKLSPASRAKLLGWMDGCQTGATRLRAGFPPDWRVGDKTGAGDRGTTNDVALVRPPDRHPFVLAVYLTGSPAAVEACNDAIASVARAAATLLA